MQKGKKSLAISQIISLILITVLGSSALALIVVSTEQSLGNTQQQEVDKTCEYSGNLVLSYLGKINSRIDDKEHNVYYSHRCGEIYYTVDGVDYVANEPFKIGNVEIYE